MNIHPTAIVSKTAQIGEEVEIGPYAVIEDNVQIGQRTKIFSHAHILGCTTIGDDCQIHIGAVLGNLAQIRQSPSTEGQLIIGSRNVFREYSTVHRSSQKNGVTIIGDGNYFMAFSHIAHDCSIANNVTICNGALIAGHVTIEDSAFISGNVTVHQFCRLGKLSMVAGLARVAKDVPPYMLLKGDSCIWAVNSVGLRRANFSLQSRNQIKKAFRLLYKSNLNVKQAIEKLQSQSNSSEIDYLVHFILQSKRGICGYKSPSFWERIHFNLPLKKHFLVAAYRLFKSNQKGQESLAFILIIMVVIMCLVCFIRPLRENLQERYRCLIRQIQSGLTF